MTHSDTSGQARSDFSGQTTIVPVVSEKSFGGASAGVYTFRVDRTANKQVIRQAVQNRYGVNVVRVATTTVPGKTKRRGRFTGQRPGYKKAMVKLAAGEKITELEG